VNEYLDETSAKEQPMADEQDDRASTPAGGAEPVKPPPAKKAAKKAPAKKSAAKKSAAKKSAAKKTAKKA
jgi:hypothetical protein